MAIGATLIAAWSIVAGVIWIADYFTDIAGGGR